MRPALSIVIFTTLLGTAQGLLLALFVAEWAGLHTRFALQLPTPMFVVGAMTATVLATAGLLSSFFHLGRKLRAWRAVMQWRTSWMSREVIVLPLFIALCALYALAHGTQRGDTFVLGALAAITALALFVCTGMIYACIKFLREWATPLTPLNFALQGLAHGFAVGAVLASIWAPLALNYFVGGALLFTSTALLGRLAAWERNRKLPIKSTLQTAIGIKHGRIEQRAQGFMGGSFNTREFFHGRTPAALQSLRGLCLGAGFLLPLILLVWMWGAADPAWRNPALAALATVQYVGLLAERWLFFAEAEHPQNLYYQRMS